MQLAGQRVQQKCRIKTKPKFLFQQKAGSFLTSRNVIRFSRATPSEESRFQYFSVEINPLKPKDPYSGRTAPLTSKCFILYIYSTNRGTEYFKHGTYSPFFFSSSKYSLFHNSNVFDSCVIHILYTGCAKIKTNNSGVKRLIPPTSW